ncbi:hypothetical protein GCM10008938_23750 [Deinococcus roseus]|uniref:Intein C-terminal splicing domain-containing protein n=2 Tax=Deinococcus roseus TaxID=392414 RepID=A0ABQ2D0Z1_9DEIO|nr:hypothetical protein GCM10008938_23750 [Deinococcus roseus]
MGFIITFPEHPFYVTERSDSEPRPKPEGHPDLSDKWVGAGHLSVGDKLKQADGTLGEVRYVNTIQETRTMYNLEVEEAHTFFVGTQGWLVHNCGPKTANGATLEHLTEEEIKRIQAYADKTGKPVYLFGSKASGKSYTTGDPVSAKSDFDYYLPGSNSADRKKALDRQSPYKLPRGTGGGQIENGRESGIDAWSTEQFQKKGWSIDDRPHIVFTPKVK